jgi:hypothetical protein
MVFGVGQGDGLAGRVAAPTNTPSSSSMSMRLLGASTGTSASGGLICPLGRWKACPDTPMLDARPW